MRSLAVGLVLVIAVVLGVAAVRTATLESRQIDTPPAEALALDPQVLAERLAGAVRIETVSLQEPRLEAGTSTTARVPTSTASFAALHRYMEAHYPRFHAAAARERVAGASLLFRWAPADAPKAGVLFAAHLDVVPAEVSTLARWTHPPFSGHIDGGFIWGRGTLDDKGSAFAILEAAELLAAEGFRPARALYIAFGHDEEIGGAGAKAMSDLLRARGVELELVLDEGLAITEGIFPGLDKPLGLIGIAEKGYVSIELIARGPGGHSSMPPDHTTAGLIGAAVARLEANPFPRRLSGAPRLMLEHIGAELSGATRFAFSNLWLTGPLVERSLAAKPAVRATIQTTQAVTMLEGSPKENMLPSASRAVVNYRLVPGDTTDGVVARARAVIDDPRIEVRKLEGPMVGEPKKESSVSSRGYRLIATSMRACYPGAVVAPSLVLGATDSRHYAPIARDVYRFMPFRFRQEDLARIHGVDERVSVEDYARAVRFYRHLIIGLSS